MDDISAAASLWKELRRLASYILQAKVGSELAEGGDEQWA